MHRSTLKYALTAVLATGAIATSPALAMPIDEPINRGDSPTGSLAGTTEKNLKKQDLRGELAKDRYFQAATPDKVQPGQPVFPSYVPALPKPKPVPASAPVTDDGDDVGIWLLQRPRGSRPRRRRRRRHRPPLAPARAPGGCLTTSCGAPARSRRPAPSFLERRPP
jgi:hypothetical protein